MRFIIKITSIFPKVETEGKQSYYLFFPVLSLYPVVAQEYNLAYTTERLISEHTLREESIAMIEATSCGGVVIFRGKILLLFKNYRNKYEGWVLPKGTVEEGEEFRDTAIREVREETGVNARIIQYIGKSRYTFNVPEDTVEKDVHWYLMTADSYYSRPQREEYFVDSGYYKYHEAYHLLKFANEKMILEKAYHEYQTMRRNNQWLSAVVAGAYGYS